MLLGNKKYPQSDDASGGMQEKRDSDSGASFKGGNRESLAGQNPTLFTTDAADAAPGFLVRKFIVGKLAMLRII